MPTSISPQLYDLTHRLNSQTLIYPGDPPETSYSAKPVTTITANGYEVHSLSLGSHTGTHLDAPSHFIANGLTVDQIPLSQLIGPAVVVDVSDNIQPRQKIGWSAFEPYEESIKPGVMVLVCTRWSEKWVKKEYFDHPYLTKDVAEELVSRGVRFVAVDTLSPDETVLEGETEGGFGFHDVVLGAGVIIAENLTNLKPLIGLPSLYISALPLKLEGIDGSPVRAIAWQIV